MIRVVTGYDDKGKPAIIRQDASGTVIHAGRYTTTELWVHDPAQPVAAGLDTSVDEWSLEPPERGACFRTVEIAPEADGAAGGTADTDHDAFQETHHTDTLDFVTVLRGEVTMIVDGAEVTLHPGDSVIQQPGVPHDWQNRSAEPCLLAGVLLSYS